MRAASPLSRTQVALFFVSVLGLGFFFTVQVRSQAAADRLLNGQDNVSILSGRSIMLSLTFGFSPKGR